MKASRLFGFGVLVTVGSVALIALLPDQLSSQQGAVVRIDGDDIGGVVNGANGPEAGVWVIAETTNLPTKFAKIVVTDDQGRYLIPDLPKANYDIWVRGYGLIDSAKVRATAGKTLNLKAVTAPSDGAAAQYYPAIYWYSMLKIPDKSEFPGTGEKGNGMPENLKHQAQWLDVVKTNGCNTCHQLGNKATRTIPKEFGRIQKLHRGVAAAHRLRSGDDIACSMRSIDSMPNEHWSCSLTGPIGSPPAQLPKSNRRGRKGSSATSSLRCGIGAMPRLICTTKLPPTSASRRSMPTVRSMVRRS